MAITSQRAGTPRSHAEVTRFLQGAAPELVTGMLGKLPPAFFIVGAPRCGTTALSKALGGHPQISFSKPKETHFLTQDHAGMSLDDLRRLYLEHSAKPAAIRRLKSLRKRVKRFNMAPVEAPPLPEPAVQALQAYFRQDVEHLSALLGRDLTHWIRGAARDETVSATP